MSDDEADPELIELLRQSLGLSNKPKDELSADTGVLRDAEFVYNNAIDVSIDMWGTRSAAKKIWKIMQDRNWSAKAWSEHELHPSLGQDFDEVDLLNFVFTMDLLNFSFWSELDEEHRFQIEYEGRRWTGYMSLVAALRRALDERIRITTPRFWRSSACTDDVIRHVFRSATDEQMPMLAERIAILREAGQVLEKYDDHAEAETAEPADTVSQDRPSTSVTSAEAQHLQSTGHAAEVPPADEREADRTAEVAAADDVGTVESLSAGVPQPHLAQVGSATPQTGETTTPAPTTIVTPDLSVKTLVAKAEESAGKLVNLVVHEFPSFRDESRYEGRKIRILKRAQIFAADLYGAFQGEGLGGFHDIGSLTMFADYRVPQILQSLGVLIYCPALEAHIRRGELLPSQSSWEVQLRGCSIFATELLRREILRANDDAAKHVNAVLIDFLLYDLAKENELQASQGEWYLLF